MEIATEEENDIYTEEENICNICCFPLLSDSNLEITLECGHRYHMKCIEASLETTKRQECPYCRAITKYGPNKLSIKVGDNVIINSTKYSNKVGTIIKVMMKMVRVSMDNGTIEANVSYKNVKPVTAK